MFRREWTGESNAFSLFTPVLFLILTKCQTKASTVPMLAPKYGLVDSEALLGRFAKYALMQREVLSLAKQYCSGYILSISRK